MLTMRTRNTTVTDHLVFTTVLLLGAVLVVTYGGLFDDTTEAFTVPDRGSGSGSGSERQRRHRRHGRLRTKPSLPPKILVGYTTTNGISKVIQAVRSGVNIVVWSFVEFEPQKRNPEATVVSSDTTKDDDDVCQNDKGGKSIICVPTFDVEIAKQTVSALDQEGLSVIHLVSFGGWNGPHLPPEDPKVLYESWKSTFGDVFDGFDWDLEGHDDLGSPTNEFTVFCLDQMGQMSMMAKDDGFIVGMAPPQSYLDVESSKFSRFLNLTDDTRDVWHSDFHYYGANSYAYVLSKYQDAIDFVSVQFYESYSKAGLSCYHFGMPKDVYLEKYVEDLLKKNNEGGLFVDFDQDQSLKYTSRHVPFPLSKLVFGFANGWGVPGDKVCYFEPSEIKAAYNRLKKKNIDPRGFMYWVM
jgi:chitinase